jgi:hypothetical protein
MRQLSTAEVLAVDVREDGRFYVGHWFAALAHARDVLPPLVTEGELHVPSDEGRLVS